MHFQETLVRLDFNCAVALVFDNLSIYHSQGYMHFWKTGAYDTLESLKLVFIHSGSIYIVY